MQLLVATTNEDKYAEMAAVFQPAGIALLSLKDFPPVPAAPETGDSFAANARQKAEFYFQHFSTPVLAEDSGLVIPALGGFPGIHSARIGASDEERIAIVLGQLREKANRDAYYICSMNYVDFSGSFVAEGRCNGEIITVPRGSGGFGYDPVFQPAGSLKTFGEMTMQEKFQYSHRGKAALVMLPHLLTHRTDPSA